MKDSVKYTKFGSISKYKNGDDDWISIRSPLASFDLSLDVCDDDDIRFFAEDYIDTSTGLFKRFLEAPRDEAIDFIFEIIKSEVSRKENKEKD